MKAHPGLAIRAEPVAALYEQCRIHHLGCFPALEDQMAGFASDFNRASACFLPDCVDALVFALSELRIGENASGGIEYYKQQAEIHEGKYKPLQIPQSILDPGNYAKWLGACPVTSNELQEMLRPYYVKPMKATKIGSWIGNVKNEGPELAEPA